MIKLFIINLVLFSAFFSCSENATKSTTNDEKIYTSVEINQMLGRGINFGNALEAPKEGEWGIVIEDSWFDQVKELGFNHVRIPIRWSSNTETSNPNSVSQEFITRVKHVVNKAVEQNLLVVINFHHYEELYENPVAEFARFKQLWTQVATVFKDYPNTVVFEILNEPHGNLSAEIWNSMIPDLIQIVRKDNPQRTLIIGLANYGGLSGLNVLQLPSDSNIIVTPHYYEPFHFTHQGAEWVEGAGQWLGTTWTETKSQKEEIDTHFEQILAWSQQNNVPIYIGEFGAYSKAPDESRVAWTKYVAKKSIDLGFSFAYWEWASGFGIYNKSTKQIHIGLWKALIPSGD